MTKEVHNYLIDPGDIDWSIALANWTWLLPAEGTVWLANRFADLFLVLSDGTVHMLDVGAGTLCKVAESKDEFLAKADDIDNANNWFMVPLADEMVAAGIELREGQCYAWKTPPVLGGQYTVANCGPLSFADYLSGYGSIHRQLQDVPDGGQVVLKPERPRD
jgi:hypothetical protein